MHIGRVQSAIYRYPIFVLWFDTNFSVPLPMFLKALYIDIVTTSSILQGGN